MTRQGRSLRRITLAAVLTVALVLTGTSPALAAGYYWHHGQQGAWWDATGNTVYASAIVDDWKDSGNGSFLGIDRYQVRQGAVWLSRPGCLWFRAEWWKRNIGFSGGVEAAYPAGVGVSIGTDVSWSGESQGWYAKCGQRGTTIMLNGMGYASRSIQAVHLCIGYSDNQTRNLLRNQACIRFD